MRKVKVAINAVVTIFEVLEVSEEETIEEAIASLIKFDSRSGNEEIVYNQIESVEILQNEE